MTDHAFKLIIVDSGGQVSTQGMFGEEIVDQKVSLTFPFIPTLQLVGGAYELLDRWCSFVLRLAVSESGEVWHYALPEMDHTRPFEGRRAGNTLSFSFPGGDAAQYTYELQQVLEESWRQLIRFADQAAKRMGRPVIVIAHYAHPHPETVSNVY